MKICFAGKTLKRCPIVFCVTPEERPVEPDKVSPEKVVVLGPGLTSAFCNEEAEFIVDGSCAGPGRFCFVVENNNENCNEDDSNSYTSKRRTETEKKRT